MSEEPVIVRLARIEEKLDRVLTHEGRISALERWRSWVTGVGVVVVAVVGWLVDKLM